MVENKGNIGYDDVSLTGWGFPIDPTTNERFDQLPKHFEKN